MLAHLPSRCQAGGLAFPQGSPSSPTPPRRLQVKERNLVPWGGPRSPRHFCRPRPRRSGAGDPAAQQGPTAGRRAGRGFVCQGRERPGSRGWGGGQEASFPEVGRGVERQFHLVAGAEEPTGRAETLGWGGGKDTEAEATRAPEPAEQTAAQSASKRSKTGPGGRGREGETEKRTERGRRREEVEGKISRRRRLGREGVPPRSPEQLKILRERPRLSPSGVRSPLRAAASAATAASRVPAPSPPPPPGHPGICRAPRRTRAAEPPVRRRAPSEARDSAAAAALRSPPELAARAGRPPGCARTPRLLAGCSPPTPPAPPAGPAAREGSPPSPFPGAHPSPRPEREGKLRGRVGTCAELQARTVTAGAAAARGGRRTRAVPDDGGERRR